MTVVLQCSRNAGVGRRWEVWQGKGLARTTTAWICGISVSWEKKWAVSQRLKVSDRQCRRSERLLQYEVWKVLKEANWGEEKAKDTINFGRKKSRPRTEKDKPVGLEKLYQKWEVKRKEKQSGEQGPWDWDVWRPDNCLGQVQRSGTEKRKLSVGKPLQRLRESRKDWSLLWEGRTLTSG